MNDDRSFFVDSRGELPAPTTTAPTLGHAEFRCHECGHPWHFGQSTCSKCNSIVFDEHVVAPSVLERVGGAIRAVVVPAKPPPPRASASLVSDLRRLQSTLTQVLDELRRTDAALIASIRGGVDELVLAQGYVHRGLATSGDRSPQCIDGLGLGLESLADFLDAAVNTIEDTK